MRLVNRYDKVAFYGVPASTTYSTTKTLGTCTGITDVTITDTTFATKVNNAVGSYNFVYGTGWKCNGTDATLTEYGITLEGTEAAGDNFSVVLTATNTYTYKRMQGFTSLAVSKNATEYSRRYVDEKNQRTNVTGFAPSMAYAFDEMSDLDVHADLVSIINGEKIGSEAVRPIIMVDANTGAGIKRDFSIVPSGEGDSNDAYTYSGDFKASGVTEDVTGTVSADGLTYTPN